ncbi:helix-turn-helix domain-containing protein [Cerasicoccus frondis]|uniref:helix-turn-helix domain-containing protein n=1 Tax=Cerasicoccus frondis TaxID=490090 RepID=UPI00285272B1|nr:helix-turn-helix transcriptional regulator [Cerasicoccus frondis]
MNRDKSDLARYFIQLRQDKKLTQKDCAERAGFSQWIITKIEIDKPVKVDSLKAVAKKGLGLDENSKEFRKLMALWSVNRGAFDSAADASKLATGVKVSTNAKFNRFISDVAIALKDLPPSKYEIFAEALGNRDIQDIIPKLHETFGNKVEE